MDRFRPFLDRLISVERVKMGAQLSEYGVFNRYLPDPVEEFDEFEFATNYEEFPNAGFTVAVENGAVKRIMFGTLDPDDPDVFRPITEEGLTDLLTRHGDALVGFFDFITTTG